MKFETSDFIAMTFGIGQATQKFNDEFNFGSHWPNINSIKIKLYFIHLLKNGSLYQNVYVTKYTPQ
jgi:hypothetical protein